MKLMKLVLHVAAITCFALGALAQSDLSTNQPADNPAKIDPQARLKACYRACGDTATESRSTCRSEGSRCFNQVFDLMLEVLAPRYALCRSIEDENARHTCELAAIGWAMSQTADARQVCTSARTTCLNDANAAEEACKSACDQMYPSETTQPSQP